jgi:tetratricopeptide (TPR) repeat protein
MLRVHPGVVYGAVAALALAVYANTLGHGFAYDDHRVIVDNPAVRDATDWRRIFTTPSWFMEAAPTIAFRPLATWTFAANHAAGGLAPAGYHLVNVVLHAVVSVLVVATAMATGLPLGSAAVAGVLFAVHPIHTEVVANGVGRAELLAAAFALAALWLRRGSARAARSALRDAASVAAFGAALLSKEHAIGFLLVLPLADLLLDDGGSLQTFAQRTRGRRVFYYAGLVVMTLAVLMLRAEAVGGVIGGRDVGGRFGTGFNVAAYVAPGVRVLTALAVLAQACRLLVWPFSLSADYSYPQVMPVAGIADPSALAGIAVALGIAVAFVVAWRRSPIACFWITATLAPWMVVSNLVVPGGTIFAERLLYLPSAGACVLAAMALAASRFPSRATAVAVAVVVLTWSVRTVSRNRVWANDLALAEATVRDAPQSAHAHDFLGRVYADLGRDDEALVQLGEATRLLDAHPDWPERLDVLYETAAIHGRRGELAAAEPLYEEIVRRAPDYFPAWINLGALRNQRGDHAGALEAADRAIAARPDVPNGYVVRGNALRGLRRPAEAVGAFEAALARAPASAEALFGVGAASLEAGAFARAAEAFQRVIAAAASVDAHRGLVMSLRGLGQTEAADEAAARARALYPNEAAFR